MDATITRIWELAAPLALNEGMEIVDQLYAGYGEDAGGGMRGGKQEKLFAEGNRYLDRDFPKLDKILKAVIWNPK